MFTKYKASLIFIIKYLFFKVLKENAPKLPTNEIFLKGTIIAIIITIPSIVAFFIAWHFLNDLILSAIISVVIHFISMGFSFKISKKIFANKNLKNDI